MVHTVTVPLDLSPCGDRAIGPAMRLALAFGADVELVTMVAPGMDSEAERAGLEERRAALGDERLRTRIIESLTFAPTLADWGARDGRLLCLSTRGRSAVGKAVLGSVAAGVAHAARAPFVMIGPGADAGRTGAFETIVACVDGTEPADLFADVIAGLHAALRADVVLVTVDAPGPIATLPGTKSYEPIERMSAALRTRHCRAERRLLEGGQVAPSVATFAQQRTETLLVVGSRQPAAITRLTRPSTALQIVRCAPAPILVVPFGRAAVRSRRADGNNASLRL